MIFFTRYLIFFLLSITIPFHSYHIPKWSYGVEQKIDYSFHYSNTFHPILTLHSSNLYSLDGMKTTKLFSSSDHFHLDKPHKYISPYIQERMNIGKISPYELEKYFPITSRELESWKKGPSFASGLLGVIISLEDSIVDLRTIYEYSFSFFTQALAESSIDMPGKIQRQKDFNPLKVYDVIGSSFKDSLRNLGWDIEDTNNNQEMEILSNRFYDIFDFMLTKAPSIDSYPGSIELIDDIISDHNEITVLTSLPRSLAIKAIERAKLVDLFKGRVDPERLISTYEIPPPIHKDSTSLDSNRHSIPYLSSTIQTNKEKLSLHQHLIRCCCMMEKNAFNSIYISSNSRNILTAKRLGLNAIAIRGNALNPHELRVADKVVSDLESLSIKDLYKVVSNIIVMSEGPGLQTAVVPMKTTTQLKAVASPMLDPKRSVTDADASIVIDSPSITKTLSSDGDDNGNNDDSSSDEFEDNG